MKKSISILLVILSLVLLFAGCNKGPVYDDATARYDKDTALGTGNKTITVTVKENDNKQVVFTIKTDAKTVGDALLENKLIAGDEGAYGLYVKVVNGLRADYDKDQVFWAFYIGGKSSMSGVDMTDIVDGEKYTLAYEKG